jgi:adenine-specific DNA-methyltransferase
MHQIFKNLMSFSIISAFWRDQRKEESYGAQSRQACGGAKKMFRFDESDLDFGIYRVMRMKRERISRFIDAELPKMLAETLKDLKDIERDSTVKARMEKIEQIAFDAGVDVLLTKHAGEYKLLKSRLEESIDISEVEDSVLSHLYNFFSRLYDDGDFISRMPPQLVLEITGKEVALSWANSDQYYIKTSERFRDYRFKTRYGRTACLKLIDAVNDAGAGNPNERRAYLLSIEQPFKELDSQN